MGLKGARGPMEALAGRHPVAFVLASVVTWSVLLMVFMGVASSALGMPYGDAAVGAIGRCAVTACVLLLVWHLGWLDAAGITRSGRWQVWLCALGGLIYMSGAGPYALYGRVTFDLSMLARLPGFRTELATQSIVAVAEEILFRGLALCALRRAWGSSRRGTLGSVVVTSLVFAALHLTHVFTFGAGPSSALALALQTCVIAVWWGALVVVGRSIWPAVILHFAANAMAAVQGLAVPIIDPQVLAYTRLLWFSVPLGILGVLMLLRPVSFNGPVDR